LGKNKKPARTVDGEEASPKQVICTEFNVPSRFLGSKRLTLDIYVVMKFFWIP
jgi:hypothetical protein